MKLREEKIPIASLVIVSGIAIFFMYLELNSKHLVEVEHFDEKKAAAELAYQSFNVIKEETRTLGLSIDSIFDPQETGLIGIPHSEITTGRANLDAKLTSINPNFASLIVAYIRETAVEKNDAVAVSFTGSFPALNIAVMSAMKTLELRPIIITSVGSTMWGANRLQFTYLDMECVLRQRGLFEFKTAAASLGKIDMGMHLSSERQKRIETAMRRNGIRVLRSEHLEDEIRQRIEIYERGGEIRLFINVGECATVGAGAPIRSGLIKPRDLNRNKGISWYFAESGVPVINLHDVTYLAQKHRLPVAPDHLPEIGEGEIYYICRYSTKQAILYLSILAIVLFVAFKVDLQYYVKRKKTV